MDHRDDDDCSADERRYGGPASGQRNTPGQTSPAAKAIRAVTATVVFGIPLLAGTVVLLGYGIHKVYKGITGKP